MNSIDYGQFITNPPPAYSGRRALGDAFTAIAEAREKRRQAEIEDAQRRAASQLTYEAAMAGHQETGRHNLADEAHAEGVLGETRTHNRNTEGAAVDALEQKKQGALAKLMADPKFVAARGSGDPQAMAPWVDVMTAAGLQVNDVMGPGAADAGQPPPAAVEPPPLTPGQAEGAPMPPPDEGPDAISGPAPPPPQAPQPTGAKQFTGPNGLSFTVDPHMNAQMAIARARQAGQGMEDVASQTGDAFVQNATKDIAPLVKLYVAQGMDPAAAMDKATAAVTARAGQASTRRNTDIAARGRASSYPDPARTQSRTENMALEQSMQKYLGEVEAKQLLKGNRNLNNAMANVAQQGPDAVLAHKDAFMSIAGYARGNKTPTDRETEFLLKNLGGLPGGAEAALKALATGDFSHISLENITRAIRTANTENLSQTGKLFRGLQAKYGPKSPWRNMPDAVNSNIRALGINYDMDLPDMYPENGGPAVGPSLKKGPAAGKTAPLSTDAYLKMLGTP